MRKHDFAALKSNTNSHYQHFHFINTIIYVQNIFKYAWYFYQRSTCNKPQRHFAKTTKMINDTSSQGEQHFYSYHIGGGKNSEIFEINKVRQFELLTDIENVQSSKVKYIDHLHTEIAMEKYGNNSQYLISKIPIHELVYNVTCRQLPHIAQNHNIFIPKMLTATNKIKIFDLFTQHEGSCCKNYVTVFSPLNLKPKSDSQSMVDMSGVIPQNSVKFPPSPPSSELRKKIIRDFCADTAPPKFEETGCAVCSLICRSNHACRYVNCKRPLHLTIYVSVFHDQYHPNHKERATETFEGTDLDFARYTVVLLNVQLQEPFHHHQDVLLPWLSELVVSYSSLVSVCTVKGHMPSSLPCSSSMS
jgi:hypothetical protein